MKPRFAALLWSSALLAWIQSPSLFLIVIFHCHILFAQRSLTCEGILLQHVPKINGEIPSIDEATSDHQRLTDRF